MKVYLGLVGFEADLVSGPGVRFLSVLALREAEKVDTIWGPDLATRYATICHTHLLKVTACTHRDEQVTFLMFFSGYGKLWEICGHFDWEPTAT